MEDWTGVAAAYKDSFASLCAGTVPQVLDAVQDSLRTPGRPRLLDVGCGTGDLALAALGRAMAVTAVDPDPQMVALTLRALEGHDAQVGQGRLPSLPLEDCSFDAVVANFVVNHVPDPRAAVAEMLRVTAPGGVLAMTIWPTGGAGWSRLVAEAFQAAQAASLPRTLLPDYLDFARTPQGLAGLVDVAAAEVIDAREVAWQWRVAPQGLWAGISGGVASAGQAFAAQTPQVKAAIERELMARAAQSCGPDGLLHLPSRAVLVMARRR